MILNEAFNHIQNFIKWFYKPMITSMVCQFWFIDLLHVIWDLPNFFSLTLEVNSRVCLIINLSPCLTSFLLPWFIPLLVFGSSGLSVGYHIRLSYSNYIQHSAYTCIQQHWYNIAVSIHRLVLWESCLDL